MEQQKITQLLQEMNQEIQLLRHEIVPRLERIEAHIDFIEDTYDGLRKPLDYVKGYFKESEPKRLNES